MVIWQVIQFRVPETPDTIYFKHDGNHHQETIQRNIIHCVNLYMYDDICIINDVEAGQDFWEGLESQH